MSTIRTGSLQARGGSGNITVEAASSLVAVDDNAIRSSSSPILQVQYATAMTTSHITVTSTSLATLALTCSITPLSATSVIKVEFFSSMQYGIANALVKQLNRKIGNGSYSALTPISATTSRYQYGWSYNNATWQPVTDMYFDSPQTREPVTYQLQYRNWSSTSTNYLVHQYQEYSWTLTEIEQ